MKMNDNDYLVRIIDLPHSVNGLIALDEEGFHNIYINAHLSAEGQRKALKHELDHLAHNDFYNNKSIKRIESQGNKEFNADVQSAIKE